MLYEYYDEVDEYCKKLEDKGKKTLDELSGLVEALGITRIENTDEIGEKQKTE